MSAEQQLAFDMLQELVEIDTTTATVNRAGGRRDGSPAARAGFDESRCPGIQARVAQGNLVARLRGTGKRKPILLLAHLDVVPANREDWSVEPFSC